MTSVRLVDDVVAEVAGRERDLVDLCRRLVAAEIMRAVYFETLRRIERRGYDVFQGRVRIPRPIQAAIALKEWLCTITT